MVFAPPRGRVVQGAVTCALVKAQAFSFKPVVQLNGASTQVLSQALNGRVYEKTLMEKKTFHIINSLTLLLARLELWKAMPKASEPMRLPRSWMSA